MSRPATKTTDLRQVTVKTQDRKKIKRQATLYDAVAGTSRILNRTVAVPPEEVLFRRKAAPIRYEEDDFYWADRHLTANQKLPESDLLKAIHAYASDFYGRAVEGRGIVDFESLGDTALLAVGVLLEEMAGDVLGETGDMAFVEGEDDGSERSEEGIQSEEGTSSGEEEYESTVAASEVPSGAITSDKGSSDRDNRSRKRRKTRHDDDSHG